MTNAPNPAPDRLTELADLLRLIHHQLANLITVALTIAVLLFVIALLGGRIVLTR